MATTVLRPANGATVGCTLNLMIQTDSPTITVSMEITCIDAGPGGILPRRCIGKPKITRPITRAAADIDADNTLTLEQRTAQKQRPRPPQNRSGIIRIPISLCDFFKQGCLRRGCTLTVTITQANGVTETVSYTIQPPTTTNGGKRCDCPANQ